MTATTLLRPLALAVAISACAAPDDQPSDTPPRSSPSTDVPRTADPIARGFTESDFPRVQEVADGVYTYEALRSAGDERFTTVSLFVVTQEGVLVADGQGSPDETRRLIETIAGITDRPITHVVICSDHGDHTGGNVSFPAGAAFLAHPTSAQTLREASRREGAVGVVVPTHEVSDREVLTLGGREVRILHLGRAHTGGDLVVYLPRERVLFMSETYLNRVFPAMRSAYPSEWVTMIERAQAMDVEVYVPGHGFVETPTILAEELEAYRRALQGVIAEGRRLHAVGLSADEAVVAADFGELEHWSLRAGQGPIAVRRVYLELDGGLPAPPSAGVGGK